MSARIVHFWATQSAESVRAIMRGSPVTIKFSLPRSYQVGVWSERIISSLAMRMKW
ncbi:MAG: hypothetical protein ABSC04_00835 [Syntrophobacteraceae bacterium]